MALLPYSLPSDPRDFVVTLPAAGWPLDAFREWVLSSEFPKNVRASYLVDQVLLDMTPEQSESHNKVKGAIYAGLLELLRENDLGSLYTDGVRLTQEEAGLSTVPDAVFVATEILRSGRVHWNPADKQIELTGTPDWVLEVSSPSSRRKDTRLLRAIYAVAGIPEYWLVNALGDSLELEILLLEDDGYTAAPWDDGWTPSRVFGHEFRLVREQGSDGLWRYALESRASSAIPTDFASG